MQNTIVKHDTEVWLQVLHNSLACRHGAPGLNTLVTVINKKFWLTASSPLRCGRSPQAANVFGIVNKWIPLKNQSQIMLFHVLPIMFLGLGLLGFFSFLNGVWNEVIGLQFQFSFGNRTFLFTGKLLLWMRTQSG